MSAKRTKISAEALREVEAALKGYVDEIVAADLSTWSKDVYTYHAMNFVRWLTGEFSPGSRSAPYTLKKPSRSLLRLEADIAKEKPDALNGSSGSDHED